MKKIILISLILLLSGCYNYKELNNYAIATGMAIDYTNDKYEVSLLIANSPQSTSESSSEYKTVIYSGKGYTIAEAIKDIGLISPKELYIGHLSIVVLSENAAKKGLSKSLDFLLQEPKSKKNFYVALAKDNKAKNILSITSPLTDFPSQTLANNIESTQYLQGSVVAIDFNTLMYEMINPGINPVLNGFTILGNTKSGAKASNIETTLPKAYIKLSNLGIFKDDKLVAWATKNESRGINIINNNVSELYIRVKCDGGYALVDTEKIKTKREIKRNGSFAIDIQSEGIINEITCDLDLTNKKNIKKIEKKAENKIKKLVQEGIKLAQSNQTDIFGIGLKYYQEYPEKYKEIQDWDKYFSKLNFETNVSIKLNHTGSIQQGLGKVAYEEDN